MPACVLLAFSLLLALACSTNLGYWKAVTVDVGNDGVVHVSMTVALDEGLHKVKVPVEPVVPTLIARVSGRPIPIAYSNNSVYLVLDEASNVTIEYIANITLTEGIFHLNVLSEDVVKILFPSTAILLTWPEERILDARVLQDRLLMLVRGPLTLKYVLRVAAIPTHVPIPSTQPRAIGPPHEVWVAMGVAASVIVTAVLATLRRRERSLGDMLGDADKAIVRALEAMGGSALQAELQNNLRLPKTTLWRHIKKLERLGIVKVEKVGAQNRVILIRRVRGSS